MDAIFFSRCAVVTWWGSLEDRFERVSETVAVAGDVLGGAFNKSLRQQVTDARSALDGSIENGALFAHQMFFDGRRDLGLYELIDDFADLAADLPTVFRKQAVDHLLANLGLNFGLVVFQKLFQVFFCHLPYPLSEALCGAAIRLRIVSASAVATITRTIDSPRPSAVAKPAMAIALAARNFISFTLEFFAKVVFFASQFGASI